MKNKKFINGKDILLSIIESKGDCPGMPYCEMCPIQQTMGDTCSNNIDIIICREEADEKAYDLSVSLWLKLYGPEKLFKVLL